MKELQWTYRTPAEHRDSLGENGLGVKNQVLDSIVMQRYVIRFLTPVSSTYFQDEVKKQ